KGTKQHLVSRANVKSPQMTSKAGLSLETIVQFDWEVALGEETLTLRELEALARLKEPLVKIRGQWVLLNAEEIEAALDFWKKKEVGQMRARDLLRMALGAEQIGGTTFEGIKATGWIADLLAQLNGQAALAEI